MPKHGYKTVQRSGTGGGGVLIPVAVVWGAIVDQVHINHLELAELYSVEWAKHCTWKGSGALLW